MEEQLSQLQLVNKRYWIIKQEHLDLTALLSAKIPFLQNMYHWLLSSGTYFSKPMSKAKKSDKNTPFCF